MIHLDNQTAIDKNEGHRSFPLISDIHDETQTGRTIQSVDRALRVFDAVASGGHGMTVSEISEKVGLNISTCHHLITTLVKRRFLTHLGRVRGYKLGPRLNELLEISQRECEPEVIMENELKLLGKKLGHSVQYAELKGTSLITKLSFPNSRDLFEEPSELKKMTALHATATGKSILAWIPDTELVRIISANGLTKYSSNTILSLSGLVEDLRLVRRQKFAIDDQEFCEGVVCIGAAIRQDAGAVVGSISISLSAKEADNDHRKYLIKEVINAANTFSNKIRKLKP
tara:strand:- start:38 stop:895 length:858 start_codon:yes stop_codon:yes gene_type:complete